MKRKESCTPQVVWDFFRSKIKMYLAFTVAKRPIIAYYSFKFFSFYFSPFSWWNFLRFNVSVWSPFLYQWRNEGAAVLFILQMRFSVGIPHIWCWKPLYSAMQCRLCNVETSILLLQCMDKVIEATSIRSRTETNISVRYNIKLCLLVIISSIQAKLKPLCSEGKYAFLTQLVIKPD